MATQGMPWFRFYSEFIDDPNVRCMPEVMQLRYILLLCLQCKGNVAVTDDNVAWLLRITNEEAIETKKYLTKSINDSGKQLINNNWEPVSWNKRQYRSDSSKERVQKYREVHSQKHKSNACNGYATVSNVSCNGHVTPPDTDTETDTDTEKVITYHSPSIEVSGKNDFHSDDYEVSCKEYPRPSKRSLMTLAIHNLEHIPRTPMSSQNKQTWIPKISHPSHGPPLYNRG